MSDTSGATDLKPETPPINAAPPVTGIARSPMQLPSALQGLAKFFTQSQPAPKPKQPPPLTEAQARQPPQHTGKPASFAPVPANIPSPTGGFTPYLKASDKRDTSQWGDPVRFPRQPATFELPGLFGGIGRYFAQAGGDVGDYASQLSGHSQAYIDAFMKAQDWKMKMEKEGQALTSAKLQDALTNRLIDNRNSIDEYTRASGGDLHKLGTTTIKGVDLYNALWANAIKDDDRPAQQMFEGGESLEHILNYLHDADKNLRDLQATRQKAGDQEAEDAAAYGLGPKAESGDGWAATAPKEPGGPPSSPAPDPPKEDANTPDWAKGIDPKLVSATEQHFRGDIHAGENKAVARAADTHAREMETEVNKLLDDAHAGRVKPSEVMEKFRKIAGSRIGDDAENVGNYSRPGYGSGMGSGGSQRGGDYAQLLDDIAKAADPPDPEHGHPGFIANGYALQDDFKKNNQIRTALIRTRDLPAMADEIKQDITILRNINKYDMNSLNWKGIYDHYTAGNPDFQKLVTDMQAYSTAYQTIQNGGRATLGGTRDVEAAFPSQTPLATYFNVIKGHMGGVRGILRGYHDDWEARGGRPDIMPLGSASIEKRIDDYWRMDAKTGAMPYDPKNPDNDSIRKPAGAWGPKGEYYWTDAVPTNRDDPRNWKRVE